MSGLLMRSHMTAAKMGFTARVPNMVAVFCTNGSHGVSRDGDRSISSIFRSRASFGLRPPPRAEVHDLRVECKVMWFTLSVGEAQMHRFTDGG